MTSGHHPIHSVYYTSIYLSDDNLYTEIQNSKEKRLDTQRMCD